MRKDEFPIVDKLVKDSINEVLDKIRAEIEEVVNENEVIDSNNSRTQNIGLMWVLQIIDKYKAESENKK